MAQSPISIRPDAWPARPVFPPLPVSTFPRSTTHARHEQFLDASVNDRSLADHSPATVFSALLDEISCGELQLDMLLHRIAEQACTLTRANGCAIAILPAGETTAICRAKCGSTAPGLGARLKLDSGISAECLRSGGSYRCLDTATDPRVDADASRRLGVRSLAIAAVHRKIEFAGAMPVSGFPVGIIEVFSARPNTFTEEQLSVVQQMAELVAVALDHFETKPLAAATPEDKDSSAFTSNNNASLLPVRGIFTDFAEPKPSLPRLVWLYTRMPAEIALGVGLVLFAAWHWWPR